MLIPYEELQPDTLRTLIEEFVSREGAVHGHREVDLEHKVSAVMAQLQRGKVVIVFDEHEEACSIITKEQYQQRPPDEPGEQRIEYDEP